MNSNKNSFLGVIPPVTKNILIINFLVWFAQYLLLKNDINLSTYLGLNYVQSDNFMPHQIFTYMFLHDPRGIGHVFFNMFAVFMFGRTLEGVWGSKRFLIYYIITGLAAGLVQELAWVFDYRDIIFNPEITQVNFGGEFILAKQAVYNSMITVGASGAVFGILVAFGMLFPNAELFIIPFPFPIKAKWFVIGYGVMELTLGVVGRPGDNVAHFAHLGGLIAGFILIMYWKQKAKKDGRFF